MPAPTIPIAALVLAVAAGASDRAAGKTAPSDPPTALCVTNGATVTSETLPNGATRNVCVFPNGSRIEAGAYFRNKHRSR